MKPFDRVQITWRKIDGALKQLPCSGVSSETYAVNTAQGHLVRETTTLYRDGQAVSVAVALCYVPVTTAPVLNVMTSEKLGIKPHGEADAD